ncbi:hypothetical protein [Streptosporangium longisporum]
MTSGRQYAYVIQTREPGRPSWSWASYGDKERQTAGRGVVDDATGSPRVFGRATFRAYLEHLVTEASEVVRYFLQGEHPEHDTDWRILVWDVPATGYDQRSTVPPAGDPLRAGYALAMAIEGGEPHYLGTWSGADVRKRLCDLVVREEESHARDAVPPSV